MSLVQLAAFAAFAAGAPAPLWTERPAPRHVSTLPSGGLPEFADVVERAIPAVVSITTVQDGDTMDDPVRALLDPKAQPQKGLGSGFFIHPDGWFVTNVHVIENATQIWVTVTRDGHDREYRARVLGVDAPTDIALLRVDAEGEVFPTLPLGDSGRLRVAEWVAVVGNPYGLAHSVTLGVVSSKGRTDIAPSGRDGYYDFIQTDAPINPGNSGGPAINREGEVVGIANAVNAVGQGIGFAIPINMAKRMLEQLASDGRFERSWLGVAVEDVTPEERVEARLPDDLDRGARISAVLADTPAAEAGLKEGDVLVQFGESEVAGAQRLRWLASTAGCGHEVPIMYLRDGTARRATVRLRPMPVDDKPLESAPLAELGIEVAELDVPAARAAGLALPLGARIRRVRGGSVAERAGIRQGDLVLKVDDTEIRSASGLVRAMVRKSERPKLVLRRASQTVFIELKRP